MKIIKRNFTLIELIVVIAVIALLAAILLPMLFSVREKARITNDTNNLKQIYQSLIYYSEDNNGYLPYIESISSGEDMSKTIWLLLPYLNYDTKLFSSRVNKMDGRQIYAYMEETPDLAPVPGFAYCPIYQDDNDNMRVLRFSDPTVPNIPIIATFDGEYDNLVMYLTFNGEVK